MYARDKNKGDDQNNFEILRLKFLFFSLCFLSEFNNRENSPTSATICCSITAQM